MTAGIYKITSPSGKCYIGKSIHIERRWRAHCYEIYNGRKCPLIYRAIQKYGKENMTFEILQELPKDNLILLSSYEIYFIKFYNSFENGYNLSTGGEGVPGRIVSQETIQKISSSNKGKKRTEECIKKNSEAKKGENHPNWGKKLKEETIQKISESKLGDKNPMFGKPAWNKGISPSEETKKKLSEAKKGKPKSEETKKKLSEAQLGEKNGFFGKKHTEETKKKLSKALKGKPAWNKGKKFNIETRRYE